MREIEGDVIEERERGGGDLEGGVYNRREREGGYIIKER